MFPIPSKQNSTDQDIQKINSQIVKIAYTSVSFYAKSTLKPQLCLEINLKSTFLKYPKNNRKILDKLNNCFIL